MIYKKNNVFCAIKTGKTGINSVSKSIKTIALKEKTVFALFSINCSPSIMHLIHCINLLPEKFTAMDFLSVLTGEKQHELINKKTAIGRTRKCWLLVFEKNKKKREKIEKMLGFKEDLKLLSSKKRLKEITEKEKLEEKLLEAFGEDFYSSLNNFFIEKSVLVVK
ncbi:hypothetical protein KKG83_01295 [Candidatus Micrarchaeota archaeon]|nr:hypothetical protein [Candidatus Micrarchaeota archaeon]MBU2476084.1 hypothetical protein [Candidatus Micrarchaeota archaeon]